MTPKLPKNIWKKLIVDMQVSCLPFVPHNCWVPTSLAGVTNWA